jgi:hypothetical protein
MISWASNQGAAPGQAPGGIAAAEYHELAPGKTLAGLMRRIDRNVKVETHDEIQRDTPHDRQS